MNFLKLNTNSIRRIKNYYQKTVLIIKIVIILLLALFFFTTFFKTARQSLKQITINFSAEHNLILQNLMIAGKKNLPLDSIIFALNADVGTPIFAIDMDKMQANLDQNTWTKNVIVQRRLPDTIYVEIEERKPIAIWQYNKKLFLIDNEAKIIKASNLDNFNSLPHVVGYGANRNAKYLIDELHKYPDLAKHVVSAVRYGDRRWNLILTQDITVKMPEQHDFAFAYKHLNKMNEKNQLFDQKYNYIDLRSKAKYFYDKKLK